MDKKFKLTHMLSTYSGIACGNGMRFSDFGDVLHYVTDDSFSVDWFRRAAGETLDHVNALHPWLKGAIIAVRATEGDMVKIDEIVTRLHNAVGELVTLTPDPSYGAPSQGEEQEHMGRYATHVIFPITE